MYDHTLHCRRKHFCPSCLQAFSMEEILESNIKDCFKINGKQRILKPKKGEYVNVKNYQMKIMKIKSPFIIHADFKSKIQKSLIQTNIKTYCCYGYKLVCVGDKFSKAFHFHFINSMIEESKYCSDVMKKHFNKELLMTKEENEYFKKSNKCWICPNDCMITVLK